MAGSLSQESPDRQPNLKPNLKPNLTERNQRTNQPVKCTAIPPIVAGPRFNRSLEVPELVSHVDVTPTLLEACGAAVPRSMQGRSFPPPLEGRRESWTDEVYIHMSEFMTGRILRTPRWTYAVAAPKRPGWRAAPDADLYVEYMLYDNAADPWQHVNLAAGRRRWKSPRACARGCWRGSRRRAAIGQRLSRVTSRMVEARWVSNTP
jgi:hypothetical protein